MLLNKSYFARLIAVTLFVLAMPLQAAIIETEGVASIEAAGIERARQMAIQNAQDQASMQAGVKMEMASVVSPKGIPLESSRVRPIVKIGNVTVVREWQVDDDYHVRISANIEQSDDFATVSQKYKKKLTSTPFGVRKPYQLGDIDDISTGFPRELLRRLENGNNFLAKNSLHALTANPTGLNQGNSAVIQLATLYGSQFVITGEILDAGNSDEGGYFGFLQQKRRRFEVDIFVYDGLTGSLIARHRIDKFTEGEVAVGPNKPFASTSFFSTRFGQAISMAIDSAAKLISRDLENLPFTAKVIRVADGKIYVDAGGTSLLAPGDKLVAYRTKRELPFSGFGPDREHVITETPVATISIVQVQPLFSIGTLPPTAKNVTMEIGDLVRFDLVDQSQN